VRADQRGTLLGMTTTLGHPQEALRPVVTRPVSLGPGTYLAVAMIPASGASPQHPALFVIPGHGGRPPVEVLSTSATVTPPSSGGTEPTIATAPDPTDTGSTAAGLSGSSRPASTSSTSEALSGASAGPNPTGTSPRATTSSAIAFPFKLPDSPKPGDSQALALGTADGGVVYNVAYSLVTVSHGQPVTNANRAYALASCHACTTVAVSVQVVLVVGQSKVITPVNTAEALNSSCPACQTAALADQIVVTLESKPSQQLTRQLTATLQSLNALPQLGTGATSQSISAYVASVQQQIDTELLQSGQVADSQGLTSTSSTSSTSPTSTSSTTPSSTTSSSATSSASSSSSTGQSSTSSSGASTSTSTTTTSTPASSTTTSSSTTTTSTTSPSTTTTAP
jgi:hypothetical protein